MKISVCLDLLYLEITPTGPVFADTEKLLNGMELAKELGFQSVEFWDWHNKDVELLLAKQQQLGLEISSICAKDRGTLADATTHDKAIQDLKATIEVAKKFKTDKIIVTALEMPGISREESHRNIVDGLRKMAKVAETEEVILILEPIFGSYFVDSAEPFHMIEEIGSEYLKVLYDLYHYQMMEGNLTQTIRKNIEKIGHIHIASTPDRTEITDGELNYHYLIKEIREMNYQGTIALEYRPTVEKKESLRRCLSILTK